MCAARVLHVCIVVLCGACVVHVWCTRVACVYSCAVWCICSARVLHVCIVVLCGVCVVHACCMCV